MTAIFTELSDDFDAKELARLQAEEDRLWKRFEVVQIENLGKINELRKQIDYANNEWAEVYGKLLEISQSKTNTKEQNERS